MNIAIKIVFKLQSYFFISPNGDIHYLTLWEDKEGNWINLTHISKKDEPDMITFYYSGELFDLMAELTEGYAREEADTFAAPSDIDGL